MITLLQRAPDGYWWVVEVGDGTVIGDHGDDLFVRAIVH